MGPHSTFYVPARDSPGRVGHPCSLSDDARDLVLGREFSQALRLVHDKRKCKLQEIAVIGVKPRPTRRELIVAQNPKRLGGCSRARAR